MCGEGSVNVYPARCEEESKKMYAILDEQSNHSLARSDFMDVFKMSGFPYPYTLKTCAGLKETAGRRASGYTVESVDKKPSFPLPTLLEYNQVPNNRFEIPTKGNHTHL